MAKQADDAVPNIRVLRRSDRDVDVSEVADAFLDEVVARG